MSGARNDGCLVAKPVANRSNVRLESIGIRSEQSLVLSLNHASGNLAARIPFENLRIVQGNKMCCLFPDSLIGSGAFSQAFSNSKRMAVQIRIFKRAIANCYGAGLGLNDINHRTAMMGPGPPRANTGQISSSSSRSETRSQAGKSR